MNTFLWQTYHRLIAETTITTRRFLYDQLNLDHRLTGIIGSRGVGKTTLLLQYIKNNLYQNEGVFYFSADNTYFNEVSLVAFVNQLYQEQNIHIFFIDEIHQYPNWNQELKNIYDSFPKVKIFFSGSSSIDLITGTYDLSRRARLLHLPGLSFREYLHIKMGQAFAPVTFAELITNHQQLAAQLSQISTLKKHFEEYMLFGYYPIVFEGREHLYNAIANIIDKTIYEDIANFYNLKTSNLNHFKRIINFLASIPPGKIKTNNIAQHLSIDNKTVDHYLDILHKTSMIKMLQPVAHGNQILTKPAKIYLDNTTLLAAANVFLATSLDIGTQRELVLMQFIIGAGMQAFYPDKGDFQINDIVFEVGGKNKTMQQLAAYDGKKMLVKDNILVGLKNEIPLYLFGFLY
jgi:hypothetical protein